MNRLERMKTLLGFENTIKIDAKEYSSTEIYILASYANKFNGMLIIERAFFIKEEDLFNISRIGGKNIQLNYVNYGNFR